MASKQGLAPWLAGLNLPVYTAALVPVLVGTAVAWWGDAGFDSWRFALVLVGLICVQGWINFSNDVFDSDTGVDRNKHDSLVNLTGNRDQVFWAGNLLLFIGCLCFAALQDPMLLLLGIAGILLGYCYAGPPLRLAYRGWGELISFTCFGPVAVLVAERAQSGVWNPGALTAGLAVGGWTAAIAYAHHFPQIEDDRRYGKRTPVVRWGRLKAAQRYGWVVLPAYGFLLLGIGTGQLPWSAGLALLGTPLALRLLHLTRRHALETRVRESQPRAVQLHLVSGLLLSIGLWFGWSP